MDLHNLPVDVLLEIVGDQPLPQVFKLFLTSTYYRNLSRNPEFWIHYLKQRLRKSHYAFLLAEIAKLDFPQLLQLLLQLHPDIDLNRFRYLFVIPRSFRILQTFRDRLFLGESRESLRSTIILNYRYNHQEVKRFLDIF